jgi:cytochrome c553
LLDPPTQQEVGMVIGGLLGGVLGAQVGKGQRLHILAAAIAVVALSGTASFARDAEPQSGRLLASNCFQCHGTNGNPVGGFDRLAGKSARKLYEEMLEFKSGKEGTGIMTLHARGYTDQQLRLMADFFSKQPAAGKRRN